MTESTSCYSTKPIPPLESSAVWQRTPIRENGEALIVVPPSLMPAIRCEPQYARMGLPGAMDRCLVRRTVAAKLERLAPILTALGLALVVWDAWRPASVQSALFGAVCAQLRSRYPAMGNEELEARARRHASPPLSDDPDMPPPHLTGGSIDVTLAQMGANELAMGTAFDDTSPRASARYFEHLSGRRHLSLQESGYLRNRRLLYHLMLEVGFTNYSEEWWHFDYGNQWWAVAVSGEAVYGPAQPIGE